MKKKYIIYICIAVVLLIGSYFIYKYLQPITEKRIILNGQAQNVKQDAEVLTDKYGPVLILNMPAWPNDVVGKQVSVKGEGIEYRVTVPKAVNNNGAISQGSAEEVKQWVLGGSISWQPIVDATEHLTAYSLSYVTLNPTADYPDFKHMMATGMGWTTFIVPLKDYSVIKDYSYLITKFSWPVLPNSVSTNVTGSTYMYTASENKFTLWPGTLEYKNTGELDAFMQWGGEQGQNVAIVIKVPPENITHIDNSTAFKQITQLPGFEKATYREVNNLEVH